MMTVSFDYYCADCDAPFCERVNLINLALNYEDEGYCLDCLVKDQGQPSAEALVAQLLPYICSRDCFKNPWQGQDVSQCERLLTRTCYCQGSCG